MNHRIQNIKNLLNKQKNKKEFLEDSIKGLQKQFRHLRLENKTTERAQIIIQDIAKKTQQELEYHISELVTLAMESIFPDPYKLLLEFNIRRDKTEADIYFERNGEKVNPLLSTGGGAIDIAAFALQISLWNLQRPKTRNTFILDEPLKWLKGNDLPKKGAELIKEISEKLGLQIIMVSHSPELIESADKVFQVTKKRKNSIVKEI